MFGAEGDSTGLLSALSFRSVPTEDEREDGANGPNSGSFDAGGGGSFVIAVCYVLGVAVGTIGGLTSGAGSAGIAGEVFRWVLLLGVGVPLLIAFFGHSFGGEAAARQLGWPAGNPFQTELGIWDGAGGVAATIAFWRHGDFWLAVVIADSIF